MMRINRKTGLALLLAVLMVLGISAVALAFAQNSGTVPDNGDTEISDDGAESEGFISPSAVKLTEADAIAIAETKSGSTYTAVELEQEGGVASYSIELKNGSEIEVDANTGSILQVEGAGSSDD